MAFALKHNADTSHQDAEGWWGSYGWFLSTREHGDISLQSVDYDLLHRPASAVIDLMGDTGVSRDEAEALVEKAKEVRDVAEAIEALLKQAVEAYEDGDAELCDEHLRLASITENAHGDDPASRELRAKLLDECDDDDEDD